MKNKNHIESVRIETVTDTDPNASHIGKYSREPGPDCIDRQERGDMGRGEFRYFIPAMTAEETGNPASPGQDYLRMEALNNGTWQYVGIIAKAVVVSASGTIQTLRSGGLWGVESDSGKEYLDSVATDELAALRTELESFGFSARAINYAFKNAKTFAPPPNMNANQQMFFGALKTAYTGLFASDPAYAYSASKCTAVEMAEKMLIAAIAGTANTNGQGFAMACKACAIPHTKKSIAAFLGSASPIPRTDAPPSVRPRKVRVLALSGVHSAMTGVRLIQFAHDLVTLEYTDGTREAALFKPAEIALLGESCFAIVSAVQAKRPPEPVIQSMAPNAHERAEWQRLALDATARGFRDTAERFASAALVPDLPLKTFDALQAEYRQWLVRGFAAQIAAHSSL
jgi:hypothetical protein